VCFADLIGVDDIGNALLIFFSTRPPDIPLPMAICLANIGDVVVAHLAFLKNIDDEHSIPARADVMRGQSCIHGPNRGPNRGPS